MIKGLVKSGITKLEDLWNIAHPRLRSRNTPDVIKAFPQVFNDNWRKFWGVQ
jgi:hypothetical protein